MGQSKINVGDIVSNANAALGASYRSFVECVWNEAEKCLVYKFELESDAEQFMEWLRLTESRLRTETRPLPSKHTVVRQYRP
jgi:hypothetical protein